MHNYYTDYFYSINLESGSIDPKTGMFSSCDHLSSFIHEYIHFLQNVLTLNGLNFTQNELTIHKRFLKHKIFRLFPFSKFYFDLLLKNAYNINTAFKIYSDEDFSFSTIQEIIPYKNNLFNNLEYSYELIVSYKVKVGNKYKTKFTTISLRIHHILESMAFMAEKIIFPNSNNHLAKNPYQIVNELTKFLCPSLTGNYLAQIVICEAALNVSNSVDFLINSLININDNKLNTSNAYNLGNHLLNGLTIEINDENGKKQNLSINDAISKSVESIIQTYSNFFQANIPKLYDWFEYIFCNSEFLKTNKTNFPISSFIFNSAKDVNFFNLFLIKMGTPYIESENFYTFPQQVCSDDLILLKCYQNIIGLLITRNRKEYPCPNYLNCERRKLICKYFPNFNKHRKALCVYGLVSKNFNIPSFL